MWQFAQGVLILTDGASTIMYNASFAADSMTLSGGNMPQPTVWTRVRGAPSAVASNPGQSEGLAGTWEGPQGLVQINNDGSILVGGEWCRYTVQGSVITLISAGGTVSLPFQLDGDTLRVEANGQLITLRRQPSQEQQERARGGSNPQELAGKWCYLASTTTYASSRMSDACLVLYANGAYEYSGESSTSAPLGSVVSQQYDSGSWTATETTITAHSRSQGTKTYRLQKMNHPKNGDPMLVLDGQWFVTYNQRPPWR